MLTATTLVITLLLSLPSDLAAGTQLRFVTWRPDPPWVWDQAIAGFESQNPGLKVIREVGLVTTAMKSEKASRVLFFPTGIDSLDSGCEIFLPRKVRHENSERRRRID